MKHVFISLTLCAALAACTNSEEKRDLVVFDIAGNVGHGDFGSLDELFEVKDYIQPELTDSTLMSLVDFKGVVDSLWYFSEARPQQILMTFDGSGKCRSSFSRVGQGPEDFGVENFVAVNPNDGNWYVNDAYGKQKTKSYTSDGKFVGASKHKFQQLHPDSKGVWASQWIREEDTIKLYNFDDKLNVVDSIVTPMIDNRVRGTLMGSRAAFESKDTIYAFLADGSLGKIAYCELGSYKYPTLTHEQMVEMASDGRLRELNRKSIFPVIYSDGKIALISYRHDGKSVFQVYDMNTGELAYSKTTDSYLVPFTFNGEEVGVQPVATWIDGSIIFRVPADELGEEDCNPMFIRVTSKN